MSRIEGDYIYETQQEHDSRIASENISYRSGKRLSRNRARRDTVRRDIFVRADSKCEVCAYGFESILHVHHIHPVSMGGSGKLSNLVLLCRNCHGLAHHYAHYRKTSLNRYEGWKRGLAKAGLNDEQAEKLLLIASHEARVTFRGELRHYKEPNPLTPIIVDDEGNPIHPRRDSSRAGMEAALQKIEERFGLSNVGGSRI